MIDPKNILGTLAVLTGLTGHFIYIVNIMRKKTKPHAYSWFVWSILSGAAFFGQFSDNAGAGAWVTGVTSTGCFVIFLLALKQGDRNFTSSDAFSLLLAVFIFSLWSLTETPLYSIILIAIVDSVGFYPTYRKSFNKPDEEAVTTYFLCGLKFFIALAALRNYTVITVLYPFCLVITNWMLVTLLIIRRRKRAAYGLT